MAELNKEDPCETIGAASCECFAHLNPAFCTLTVVPAQCSDFCGVSTEPGPPECEPPNEASCECKVVMDPAFCGTCPDCGGCNAFCEVADIPECKGQGVDSCACKLALDSGFCNTCASAGGVDCGDCEGFCAAEGVSMAELNKEDPCETIGAASCECFAHLNPAFCTLTVVPAQCSDFCGVSTEP